MMITKAITLGSFLKERRDDLRGGPQAVSQQDIASALDFVQAHVSKIEHDGVDVKRWPSSLQWRLLKAYQFSDEQAYEVAKQFNLDVPQPPSPTSALVGERIGGVVSVRYYGTVADFIQTPVERRRFDDPQHYVEVPEIFLFDYPADDCFVVMATSDTRVDPWGKDNLKVNIPVIFNDTLTPEPGHVVLCQLEVPGLGMVGAIKEYLAPEAYTVLSPLGGQGKPVIIEEALAGHVRGVYLGGWIAAPHLQQRVDAQLLDPKRKSSSQKN